MKDQQTNVIPFPKSQQPATPSTPAPVQKPSRRPAGKKKMKPSRSLAITVGSMLAIAIATGTTNSAFFSSESGMASLASRVPQSVDSHNVDDVLPALPEERDAAWEKSIAESLASTDVRDMASVAVGHEASLDEKVRYGILERKYTILRDLKRNEVESIILQGTGTPSLVPNRSEFLGKFGRWMSEKYGFSEMKSSEVVKDRRLESFTVFDSSHKAYALAKFELDTSGHLLAFHFEPL